MLSKIMSTGTGTQNMDEVGAQNMDVVVDFLKEMFTSFNDCYKNVEQIKCANKKMVKKRFYKFTREGINKEQVVVVVKLLWCEVI